MLHEHSIITRRHCDFVLFYDLISRLLRKICNM